MTQTIIERAARALWRVGRKHDTQLREDACWPECKDEAVAVLTEALAEADTNAMFRTVLRLELEDYQRRGY